MFEETQMNNNNDSELSKRQTFPKNSADVPRATADEKNYRLTANTSPYLADPSSPLSSISIPSPPSVPPTPEFYNKNQYYKSVAGLEVSRSNPDTGSSYILPSSEAKLEANASVENMLSSLVEMKSFLRSVATQFTKDDLIYKHVLMNGETISCIKRVDTLCITGTDIVRILAYRFSVFGREIVNRKKFEEGIFSDLRNLKLNEHAVLEYPKSNFLELLYKNQCVRTKKKQKVFFWYSVQHEKLFIDALERELKKDAAANETAKIHATGYGTSNASTKALHEPALSFKYDPSMPLVDQLRTSISLLPRNYADLVLELTSTELITQSNNSLATNGAYDPNGGRTPTSNWLNDAHSQNTRDTHPGYPITPIQTILSPYGGKTGVYTPPNNPHGTLYNQHERNIYQTPQSITQSREHGLSMDDETLRCGYNYTPLVPAETKYDADSDFPLDILVKDNDYNTSRKPDYSQSFEAKYTDFAHHNRPALSLENHRQTLWLKDTGPATTFESGPLQPEFLSPFMTQGYYPVTGTSGISAHSLNQNMPPLSPDWEQFILSEPPSAANRNDLHPKQPSQAVLGSPFRPSSYHNHHRQMSASKFPDRVIKSTHRKIAPNLQTYLYDEI